MISKLPKLAVITPYCAGSESYFEQCLESVLAQTIACVHIVVCDGETRVPSGRTTRLRIMTIPGPHHDTGNAARAVGGILADAEGFDAVAYLDADNWYDPDHVQLAWESANRTESAVISSARHLHALDGLWMGRCHEVNGTTFVDTNCLFLRRPAFGLLSAWAQIPHAHAAIGDRIVWARVLKSGLPHTHTGRATVHYRTPYKVHYDRFGLPVPDGAKVLRSTVERTTVIRHSETAT
jgi:glycosyltransferase involved in cell wall biosynthesis